MEEAETPDAKKGIEVRAGKSTNYKEICFDVVVTSKPENEENFVPFVLLTQTLCQRTARKAQSVLGDLLDIPEGKIGDVVYTDDRERLLCPRFYPFGPFEDNGPEYTQLQSTGMADIIQFIITREFRKMYTERDFRTENPYVLHRAPADSREKQLERLKIFRGESYDIPDYYKNMHAAIAKIYGETVTQLYGLDAE